MNSITNITVSKETVSDDSYLIARHIRSVGSFVKAGELVGSLETSKTDIDILSPCDGFINYCKKVGDYISVGEIFAEIHENSFLDGSQEVLVNPEISQINNTILNRAETRISKPALKLMNELNIDVKVFANKTIIDKADVLEYFNKNQNNFLIREFDDQNSRTKKVIIIGGGKHTKVCIELLEQRNEYDILGILYTEKSPGESLYGYPVLGKYDELNKFSSKAKYVVLGIGGLDSLVKRGELFDYVKSNGFDFINLIHKSSVVEPSAIIGEGNQIMAGAIIGSDVTIGNNCILNSNVVVSHDCTIGDHVHLTPGCILGGTVSVGANSLIGMGVTVLYQVKIGTRVIINNGIDVFRNVTDNSHLT